LSADLMATGRQSLQDIINKGMQAAGTVGLAQKYNPSLYNKQANTTAAAFRTGFEGKLRGRLPGSLFDTSNLANIAGAAQGPQNTAFDPISLAGRPAAPKAPRAKIREDEDDEEFVF
jgi:hypothetical protein